MARHFLELAGATTLATDYLLMTHRAVGDLVQANAMGVVHGQAGLGKTYAVEETLARVEKRPTCWVSFPSRPSMKLVASRLLAAVTGVPSPNFDRFKLMGRLVEELRYPHRLIVVDEAQHLNSECLEFLRYLHDDRQTNFALLLVGGDGTWEVLSREPMLRSRIYRRVIFKPLPSKDVPLLMRAYHPVYASAEEELLLFVDDQFAHGNLRHWASFTYSAARLCAETRIATLDENVVRNVFALEAGALA